MNVERISHNNSLWLVYRMLAEDYFDIMNDDDALEGNIARNLYEKQKIVYSRILERIGNNEQ